MRRRAVLTLGMAALLGAGCGNGEREPAAIVPQGAALYAEATLDPEGAQEDALDALVVRLSRGGDPRERIEAWVDRTLAGQRRGMTFEKDVEPWLGDRLALFAVPGEEGEPTASAMLVATDDEDAALRAADRLLGGNGRKGVYQGVSYRRYAGATVAGAHHGYLVVGSEPALRATVDASREGGRPLSAKRAYREPLERADGERLATVFVDASELLQSVQALGVAALTPFGQLFQSPYLATVSADGAGLDGAAELPASIPFFLGRGTDLLGDLPGDAWLAFGQADLGKALEGYTGLFSSFAGGPRELGREVTGWMGDMGLFVRGRSERELNGALVVETRKPAASARSLRRLRRRLAREKGVRVGRLRVPGGGRGFTARAKGAPRPFHFFQRRRRVVAAYGSEGARQAVEPRVELAAEPSYAEAVEQLGRGFTPSAFVSFEPFVALSESSAPLDNRGFRRSRALLERLGVLVTGTREDGGRLASRLRLTVPSP